MSSQAVDSREGAGGTIATNNMDEKKNAVDAVAATTDLPTSDDDIDAKRESSRTKSIFAVLGCVSCSFSQLVSHMLEMLPVANKSRAECRQLLRWVSTTDCHKCQCHLCPPVRQRVHLG